MLGGGGSVANTPFDNHVGVGYYTLHWIIPNLYNVTL